MKKIEGNIYENFYKKKLRPALKKKFQLDEATEKRTES